DRRNRRGVGDPDRACRSGDRQSDFSSPLRHCARVRPRDPVDCRTVDRVCRAARRGRRIGGVVDRAPPRRPVAVPPMTSFVLAWRTAMCYRARSALAMAGVAIIGALLFDMLLLSRGLVDSFADLLNTSGFDVRVVASEGLPMLRGPIHGAPALAA